jgi:hypothetical protein
VTHLAPTFRDAVKIASKLGFDFIWTDSLCIMQNSLQEWQHEASIMNDIYKYSSCNVAATASSNGDRGYFRGRDPRYIKPCLVSTRFSNRRNSTYWLESQRDGVIPHD